MWVNTSFAPNSTTQNFGPSDAGKTTFLKILAGLVHPEQGTIRVDNKIWLDTQSLNLLIIPALPLLVRLKGKRIYV